MNKETLIQSDEAVTDENKGLESLDELKVCEVVRTEFMPSAFKAKLSLNYENISFNKACVELLPNTQYINILIDRFKKRIIVLPVKKNAKDALRWCNIRKTTGEVIKRTCTARKFGEKLYNMMNWTKENRYRVLAYYQAIDGVQLLVFNLEECEIIVPEFVTTKTGKTIKRGRIYLPDEWKATFGMPLEQHKETNVVELNGNYTLSDRDKEVKLSEIKIIGKIPTEEEIVLAQYREEKPQEGVLVNA